MSEVFIQRLRSVRDEFDAAREALAYINKNWQKLNIAADIRGLTPTLVSGKKCRQRTAGEERSNIGTVCP